MFACFDHGPGNAVLMRWLNFLFIQCILVVMVAGIVYSHKDKVSLFKTPPASIAQWYKPENKRQVWLHNMFKLRRELQAIQYYAHEQKAGPLQKWLDRFSVHYLKIAEMVPEWQKKLDTSALDALQRGIDDKQAGDVTQAIESLEATCDDCHRDYRVVTAALYRAPDFSGMELPGSGSFDSHMETLITQVNQIKIASEDGLNQLAQSSLADLKKGLNELGESCSNCHDQNPKSYPSDEIRQTIARLEARLLTGSVKEQGQEIGALAVQACARCHGTHRLSFDAKQLFGNERSWLELLKH